MHTLLKIVLLQAALGWPFGSFAQALNLDTTPVIGGPCEGCEFVFQGMPAELTSDARIAPPKEPGDPLNRAANARS